MPMTRIRELTAMPDMPSWVRIVMAFFGMALLLAAVLFARPLLDTGWSWGRGVFVVVCAVVGLDLAFAAFRKRWPWLMDLVMIGGV